MPERDDRYGWYCHASGPDDRECIAYTGHPGDHFDFEGSWPIAEARDDA